VPRRGRDWRLRIQDILNAVARIEKFTRGLTLETFILRLKTGSASKS
jgi:uncharacterized protein with HEPN domain